MEKSIQILKELSEKIDLNPFYSVRLYKNQIELQGTNTPESRSVARTLNAKDFNICQNGYFVSKTFFNEFNIDITLT